MRILPIMFLALFVTGCTQLYEPVPTTTPVTDETVISRTSAMSHTYILDRETPFVSCAEPSPDSGFSQGSSGDVSVSLINLGGSDEAGTSEESEEIELAGRSPGVLMTRELFFRLCEFSRNYRLDKEEAKTLYVKTLDAVSAGWASEAANTEIKVGEATTHTVNQTITGDAPTLNALPGAASVPAAPVIGDDGDDDDDDEDDDE